MESLNNESDHIIIKLTLHKDKKLVTTNAMIDSGATEDFIDKQFCIQHQFPVRRLDKARDIYVIDGKSSTVGPITHEAIIPMNIGSHREQIRFQVANLQKHEAILGMPWLKKHNPTMNWDKEQISFNSERGTDVCLQDPPVVKAIPEEEANRENLRTKIMNLHPGQIQVRKTNPEARILSKGSERAAGRDLYADEEVTIPPGGRKLIRTGILLAIPNGSYARIAPRSGLAVKYGLNTGAGVIDADYTGEVKVLLMNTGEDEFRIRKYDRIAQIIIKRIIEEEWKEKLELPTTKRSDKGFGSTDNIQPKPMEINFISARAFGRMYKRSKKQGDQAGLIRIKGSDKGVVIASATISTELAIAQKNQQKEKKQIKELVPKEYHEYLSLFEEEE